MDTPNYNEKPIAGSKWQRTCAIRIDNTYDQLPSAMTVEEIIKVEDDGEITHKDNGNLYLTFDPNDPDDMFVYNHLNAKTIAARQARDAAAAQQPEGGTL